MAAEVAEIERLIAMHTKTIHELEPSLQMTKDAAIALEEQKLTHEVKQLEDTFKSYLLLELRLMKTIEALNKIKALSPKFLDDSVNASAQFGQLTTAIDTELESAGVGIVSKDKRLKDFKLKVWRVNHPHDALPDDEGLEGEDLIVLQSQEENIICPITRTTFELPMTNPACGHTYSRDAVMEYIKKRAAQGGRGRSQAKTAPCPVAGCSCQVDASALVVNEEMQKRLTKAARRKPAAARKRKPESDEEEVLQL